jgi:chemotaxis protein CheD
MMPFLPQGRPASLVITQGEFAVGDSPDMVISTILGSCVAVCLRDPILRIGGMNHILLPNAAGGRIGAVSFGASDMERLMNALLKRGAMRSRLEAKVFGGAAVVSGLSDIGAEHRLRARLPRRRRHRHAVREHRWRPAPAGALLARIRPRPAPICRIDGGGGTEAPQRRPGKRG